MNDNRSGKKTIVCARIFAEGARRYTHLSRRKSNFLQPCEGVGAGYNGCSKSFRPRGYLGVGEMNSDRGENSSKLLITPAFRPRPNFFSIFRRTFFALQTSGFSIFFFYVFRILTGGRLGRKLTVRYFRDALYTRGCRRLWKKVRRRVWRLLISRFEHFFWGALSFRFIFILFYFLVRRLLWTVRRIAFPTTGT